MPRSATAKNLLGGRFQSLANDSDGVSTGTPTHSIREGLFFPVPNIPPKALGSKTKPEIRFSIPTDESLTHSSGNSSSNETDNETDNETFGRDNTPLRMRRTFSESEKRTSGEVRTENQKSKLNPFRRSSVDCGAVTGSGLLPPSYARSMRETLTISKSISDCYTPRKHAQRYLYCY